MDFRLHLLFASIFGFRFVRGREAPHIEKNILHHNKSIVMNSLPRIARKFCISQILLGDCGTNPGQRWLQIAFYFPALCAAIASQGTMCF